MATTASLTTGRTITLGTSGGTITAATGTGLFLAGQITGTGPLNLSGPSTGGGIFFDGTVANNYSGLTTVQQGLVRLQASATAISGDLEIDANGIVTLDDSAEIDSAATVTVNGALRFSGTNADVAQTISTLQGSGTIDNASATGRGTLTVGAGNFAGTISDGSDAVALVKNTGGTLVLSRNNSYSGGTTINGGTIQAASSMALGTGAVNNASGTLEMTQGTHLTVGSTFAQGLGGTLHLVVYSPTASDQVNVTGTASLGGTLSIDLSGLPSGNVPAGTQATTTTYTLLTSDGLNNTTFNAPSYSNLPAGETETITYTSDDVLLNVQAAAILFPTTGNLTANQKAILAPINRGLSTGNNSLAFQAIDAALTKAYSNNPAGFGPALDEFSPQAFQQFTSQTAFNNASFETEAMDHYLAGLRDASGNFLAGNGSIDASGLTVNDPSYDPDLAVVHSRLMAWNAAPLDHGLLSDVPSSSLGGVDMKESREQKSMASSSAYTDPWSFYVRGNVVLAQGFSGIDTPHFDDNTESVVLGTDYRITPNILVGLTAGYAHTDVTLDDFGSSSTVDSYSPGFYAAYADKGWYANLSGDYLHNAYTQARIIPILGQTASSAPEGNQGVANLDGGYDFHQGALTLGPLAGIQYTHLSIDGYTESGSVADLSVADNESDSLRSRLGGRISYALSYGGMTFAPHLDASWQHEFLDQSRGVATQFNGFGGGSFSVRTIDPSRDSALFDAGLDVQINHTVTAFTDYEVQAGQSNYFGQSIQAGLKIGF